MVPGKTMEAWGLQQWEKFIRLRLKAALLRPKKERKWVVRYVETTCEQLKEHPISTTMTEEENDTFIQNILFDKRQDQKMGLDWTDSVFIIALKLYDKDEDRY